MTLLEDILKARDGLIMGEAQIPKGATHYFASAFYKKGLHGYIFYWQSNKEEWQRSSYESLNAFNKIGYHRE